MPQQAKPQPLASVEDLMEIFQITRDTVYTWRATSYGPAPLKIGRHLMYRYSDIHEFIEERAREEALLRPVGH